jgi:hypothetical protein
MVHQGISRRVLRGATYDPGHWTFYNFVEGDLAHKKKVQLAAHVQL